MKTKNILFPFSLFIIFSLTSCVDYSYYQKRNFFIGGSFVSSTKQYYLDVKNITFEEKMTAEGINVVTDKVLQYHTYFQVCFYKYENSEKSQINLINLQYKYKNKYYVDENNIIIKPYYPNHTIEEPIYQIKYGKEKIDFFKYMD